MGRERAGILAPGAPPPVVMPTIEPQPQDGSLGKRVPTHGNVQTMNLPDAVLHGVLASEYFYKELLVMEDFETILNEIFTKVDYIAVWASTDVPSTTFCILYRLFLLRLTETQLELMLESRESSFVRALAVLYLRMCGPPDQLWDWLGPYADDTDQVQTIKPIKGKRTIAIGALIRSVLENKKYDEIYLPRLPAIAEQAIKRGIAEHDRLVREEAAAAAAPPPPVSVRSPPRSRSRYDDSPPRSSSSSSSSSARRSPTRDTRINPRTGRPYSRSPTPPSRSRPAVDRDTRVNPRTGRPYSRSPSPVRRDDRRRDERRPEPFGGRSEYDLPRDNRSRSSYSSSSSSRDYRSSGSSHYSSSSSSSRDRERDRDDRDRRDDRERDSRRDDRRDDRDRDRERERDSRRDDRRDDRDRDSRRDDRKSPLVIRDERFAAAAAAPPAAASVNVEALKARYGGGDVDAAKRAALSTGSSDAERLVLRY